MIQARKLQINAARSYHTDKRCFLSTESSPAQPSVLQQGARSNNSPQQHLSPSHRAAAMSVMGHGQKHFVLQGQDSEQTVGEAFVFNLVT